MQIVINTPDKNAPGYLRRMRDTARLQAALAGGLTVDGTEALVAFILPYVVEPADRAAAEAALWDASEAEFAGIMAGLAGAPDPLAPAPASD
jgi:hypothetical protein